MENHSGSNSNSADCFRILSEFSEEHSPLVRLAHRLGPLQFNMVLEEFGGEKPHFPTQDAFWKKLEREIRDRNICSELNGCNYSEVALKYGMCERNVRDIERKMREKRETNRTTIQAA
ncbi:MAG: hypothetical protein HUJ30_02340 [Gammaproteobacteria bacterium]|nr:hypothetical protein [Gammaproteobacteria bacterium]